MLARAPAVVIASSLMLSACEGTPIPYLYVERAGWCFGEQLRCAIAERVGTLRMLRNSVEATRDPNTAVSCLRERNEADVGTLRPQPMTVAECRAAMIELNETLIAEIEREIALMRAQLQ